MLLCLHQGYIFPFSTWYHGMGLHPYFLCMDHASPCRLKAKKHHTTLFSFCVEYFGRGWGDQPPCADPTDGKIFPRRPSMRNRHSMPLLNKWGRNLCPSTTATYNAKSLPLNTEKVMEIINQKKLLNLESQKGLQGCSS